MDNKAVIEKFFALDPKGKKKVHILMGELALASWKNFVAHGKIPLNYCESVAGTLQSVDPKLPEKALEAVKNKSQGEQIYQEYQEPICAMQDDDWVFNNNAQMAYYAIYNTFKKYVAHKEIDNWIIVNQALSSLGEGADIYTPLRKAVAQC